VKGNPLVKFVISSIHEIAIAFAASLIIWHYMGSVYLPVLPFIGLLLFLTWKYRVYSPFLKGELKPYHEIIGKHGVAKTDINPQGVVIVDGEPWVAKSEEYIGKGEKIEVTGRMGLKLLVKKAKSA